MSLWQNDTYTYVHSTGSRFNKMLRDFYTLIPNFSLFFCVSRLILASPPLRSYPLFLSLFSPLLYRPPFIFHVCPTLSLFVPDSLRSRMLPLFTFSLIRRARSLVANNRPKSVIGRCRSVAIEFRGMDRRVEGVVMVARL